MLVLQNSPLLETFLVVFIPLFLLDWIGLSMDPETGIISGTPELVSMKTIFTISAIYHATSKQYATEITITTNGIELTIVFISSLYSSQ